jgi:hypothetical protein
MFRLTFAPVLTVPISVHGSADGVAIDWRLGLVT